MYILNIFENGVDGIKVNYPQNANDSIKKVIFLNNLIVDESSIKKDRIDFLKKLNQLGYTFYFARENDVEKIDKKKWDELYEILNDKNKKMFTELFDKKHKKNGGTKKIKRRYNKKNKKTQKRKYKK
jgi:DNA repair photolyase